MKIEKTFSVAAPQQVVWDTITSPQEVASCIPGCEEVSEIEPGKYKASIKVQVGPIKTKFQAEIEALEERPPEYAAYLTKGSEGGKASKVTANSALSLRAISDKETEVSYSSEINIVGRLGKFGQGMMHKVADSMGDKFVDALRDKVGGQQESSFAFEGMGAQTEKSSSDRKKVIAVMAAGIAVIAIALSMIL